MDDQARQCCADIPVEDLNSNDGVKTLITKLESLYKKDEAQHAFNIYEDFESFQRPTDMNVVDYINEFDRLYSRLKEKKMELPDGVLAYRLLKSANVTNDKQMLCRATITDLTFANMKKQIKAVFNQPSGSKEEKSVAVKVEPEETFYNEDRRKWRSSRVPVSKYSSYNERKSKSKTNPPGKNGQPSRCVVCDSIMHWVKDCPHKKDNEVKLTLFTKSIKDSYSNQFVMETFNKAVLDSGCSRTVCGKDWLDCYIQSLPDNISKIVDEKESNVLFKFGDGKTYKSLKTVTLPVTIGVREVNIVTEVVNCELPLLLSKSSMKAADTKIDFTNDRVKLLGQELDLCFTSSGHYYIPLCTEPEEILHTLTTEEEKLSVKNKRKAAHKLHLQFAHATSERIIKLAKDAGSDDKELFALIKEIAEKCETCKRYSKPKLRPAIGFSLAKEFNDVLSMDLKDYNGTKFLHMIDHSTRFSAASIICSKRKETIVDCIFKYWVSIFGCPKRILSDNGGEFNNELMRDLGELLNARVMTTAAESPWQNGITERHNGILGIYDGQDY